MSRAESYLYDLWNDADHLGKLADLARRAEAKGNRAEALDWLRQMAQPAGLIEMRMRDCVRELNKPNQQEKCCAICGPSMECVHDVVSVGPYVAIRDEHYLRGDDGLMYPCPTFDEKSGRCACVHETRQ